MNREQVEGAGKDLAGVAVRVIAAGLRSPNKEVRSGRLCHKDYAIYIFFHCIRKMAWIDFKHTGTNESVPVLVFFYQLGSVSKELVALSEVLRAQPVQRPLERGGAA